ncbi:MAG: sporulation protein YabP [Lachnospiraceae bacterium]|nr:sporulation protein YabP [Lachnospiraceae bacterium]
MEDLNNVNKRVHKIMLTNRRTCTINGVNDVLSFDIHEVLLETEQGMLMIKGDELHVNRLSLDKGEVDVDGKIDSLTYSENTGYSKKGESFLSRLLK